MASLKEIKGRIASVGSTQKITSAMRMVASAKLHRVQGMTEKYLIYCDALKDIMAELEPSALPGGTETETKTKTLLLVPVSSNSGLCGAFNSNLAKATFERVDELRREGTEVKVLPIGKKIAHELRKAGLDCNLDYVALAEQVEKEGDGREAARMMQYAVQLCQDGEIDGMEFVYHHFKSMGCQLIARTGVQLRVCREVNEEGHGATEWRERGGEDYLTEPSRDELVETLFPRLLNAQAYGVMLDSLASEHAARMLAMQTADDNANDLLKELKLLYNKTRQQSITNELIDIMSGAIGSAGGD